MTELFRPVALDRIGKAPTEHAVEANAAECAALARRLRIPAVQSLRCSFTLHRVAGSIVAAAGVLEASVVQVCVITAEEFPAAVYDEFALHFVPEGTEAPDDDLDQPDQIPYHGTALDLGEAAAQQLALALDPYPRAPGADLALALPPSG